MTNRMRYVLALCSLALTGCATQQVTPAQFITPAVPLPDVPRLTHAEKMANPPHPALAYEDFEMEPTRFIFRPRNVVTEDPAAADNGDADNGDYGYQEMGGFEDFGGGEGF